METIDTEPFEQTGELQGFLVIPNTIGACPSFAVFGIVAMQEAAVSRLPRADDGFTMP